MKAKYFCRRCGTKLMGDGGYCHVCHECKTDVEVEKRCFPDDPKNKVFTVDVHIPVGVCMKFEAKDADEAKRIAYDKICDELEGCGAKEALEVLGILGSEVDVDSAEYEVSGEADENGEIRYY